MRYYYFLASYLFLIPTIFISIGYLGSTGIQESPIGLWLIAIFFLQIVVLIVSLRKEEINKFLRYGLYCQIIGILLMSVPSIFIDFSSPAETILGYIISVFVSFAFPLLFIGLLLQIIGLFKKTDYLW